MYASLDKKQAWPGILTVGAEGRRGWKFFLIDAPDDTRVSDLYLFSEVDRIWLAVARAQLHRTMEVSIEKEPQGNPKLREAFVDQFKLFTAMSLAATALLSRLNPHDTPTNVGRLMEAAKNCEADLEGGIVPDCPHPASADASLRAGSLPYPNIPWGVDERGADAPRPGRQRGANAHQGSNVQQGTQ
eukprot:jgi/Tetstr1/459471/TSEL_004838.t1